MKGEDHKCDGEHWHCWHCRRARKMVTAIRLELWESKRTWPPESQSEAWTAEYERRQYAEENRRPISVAPLRTLGDYVRMMSLPLAKWPRCSGGTSIMDNDAGPWGANVIREYEDRYDHLYETA